MSNNTCCRVCGYALGFAPWGEDGLDPTWEICPCCGTEFGYEDFTIIGIRHARQQWIDNGMVWFDTKEKPQNWDVKIQLNNIPKELMAEFMEINSKANLVVEL